MIKQGVFAAVAGTLDTVQDQRVDLLFGPVVVAIRVPLDGAIGVGDVLLPYAVCDDSQRGKAGVVREPVVIQLPGAKLSSQRERNLGIRITPGVADVDGHISLSHPLPDGAELCIAQAARVADRYQQLFQGSGVAGQFSGPPGLIKTIIIQAERCSDPIFESGCVGHLQATGQEIFKKY